MYDSHLHTMFAREPLPLSSLTTWHLSAMCASAAVLRLFARPYLSYLHQFFFASFAFFFFAAPFFALINPKIPRRVATSL